MRMTTAIAIALLTLGQYSRDVEAAIVDYKRGEAAGYEYRYLDLGQANQQHEQRNELAIKFWLPHLSRELALSGQRPERLPGTSLYRIDLDGLGWSVNTWVKLAKEYPYQPGNANPLIMRADWLCWITADQESNKTTAYYDLLFDGKPPANKAEWLAGLGVTENKRFAQAIVIDAEHSGVALNTRKLEVSPAGNGADFWQSFDTADDSKNKDAFADPDNFKFDAQELIVGLTKVADYSAEGDRCIVLAFFLCDAAGVRAESAPPTIANDKTEFLRNSSVRTPGSCVQCHGAFNGASDSLIRDAIKRGVELTTKEKRARAAFEALYLGMPGKQMTRGNEDYADFGTVHCEQPIDLARKAWTAFVTEYNGKLTLKVAAREVLSDEEELRDAAAYYSEVIGPAQIARLANLVHDGEVSRKQWQAETYHQARAALDLWRAKDHE